MYPEEYKMLLIERQLKRSLNDGTTIEKEQGEQGCSYNMEAGSIKLRFLKFLKVFRLGGPTHTASPDSG
jgi:hypothetical protein